MGIPNKLIMALGLSILSAFSTSYKALALDSRYLRNGECYMLIGETKYFRGIYRLNNPVKNQVSINKLVIEGDRFNNSFGIQADLYRNLYTFTENLDPSFRLYPQYIYRQVLYGVTDAEADIGTGTNHHHDSRSVPQKNRDIYRPVASGAASRAPIKHPNCSWNCWNNRYGSGCTYKILNPGTPIWSKPAGVKLPSIKSGTPSHKLYLQEYDGKPWFKIPNGSWWSSWRKSGAGYLNYVDSEEALDHHYMKWTWTNNKIELENDDVEYPNVAKGNEVAASQEKRITRESVNGCLDTCGAATDTGFEKAATMTVDIAMQPPMIQSDGKLGNDRTYSLSREENSSAYSLKIAEGNKEAVTYNKGWIRGTPDTPNSKWIGISLKDATQDYVYIMGPETIKQWHRLCVPNYPTDSMNITAVGVSNQWNQKGGIVYAYDKKDNCVYKFVCKDTGDKSFQVDPGVSQGGFETILIEDEIKNNGGYGKNCVIDDIKADGFGSLFLGLTYPVPHTSLENLRDTFKLEDAVHCCVRTIDESKNYYLNIILQMEYAKVVFERNVNGEKLRKIGGRPFAWDYFRIQPVVSEKCWDELKNLSWPNTKWLSIINKYNPSINEKTWKNMIEASNGNCEHKNSFLNLDYGDPGHCKLAVINVPTPDKVIGLNGNKSYLDIIGPYEDYPARSSYSTEQGNGLMSSNSVLDLNKVYYYMVENYPLDNDFNTGVDPNEQPDWDNDGRKGGFVTTIMDRNPYDKEHTNGVKYEWKTWMVMDLYGNCCCELVDTKKADDGGDKDNKAYYYNFIYSPVFGKFIMTCKVKYNWINYDLIPFGGNIDAMNNGDYDKGEDKPVKNFGTLAIPVATDGVTHQKAINRLNEIKNSFTYKGKKFMLSPFDQDGNTISVSYDKIVDEEDGEYLALEPITVGSGVETPPPPVYQSASIERCDDVPTEYIFKEKDSVGNKYWNGTDSNLGYFGIKAGKVYNWRINLASQTNLIDFAYLRNEMKNNEKSPFYANGKKETFEFLGNEDGSDLRWADNKILVSASLVYEVPKEGGGTKKISIALKQGVKNSSTSGVTGSSGAGNGTDYEYEFPVTDKIEDIKKNLVYYTTAGDLPPTDPTYATIRINMRRQYSYDMLAKRKSDGKPLFYVPNLPGWLQITGEAKILIIDGIVSNVVWEKTSHNNLFGITGKPLTINDGPDSVAGASGNNKNPEYVSFSIKDNNPWDALETPAGLKLSDHVTNYADNYGPKKCEEYCKANTKLEALRKKDYGEDIEGKIQTALKSNLASSHLNYKPMFSKAARDVRISFETSSRIFSDNPKENGKAIVNRADTLFSDVISRKYTENDNEYAFHYHNSDDGSVKYEKYLKFVDSSFVNVVGNTNVYNATNNYKFSVVNLPIGTIRNASNANIATSTVPDGYANNTPGYRPYKFYISMTDSSGNYVRDKLFNVALHVRDDIPPIGYGSIFDYKNEVLSYFPCMDIKDVAIATNTPCYTLDKNNYSYFGSSLNEKLVKADWKPSETSPEGYINDASSGTGVTYKAIKSLGDKVSTNVQDNIFLEQIKNGVPPHYMEDNVECEMKAFVSDNCGNATATLKVSYFVTADGGSEATGFAQSSWSSAAKIASDSFDSEIASSSEEVFHNVFRGKSGQFIMGIPIEIVAEDDARDWDYYNPGTVNVNGDWDWNTITLRKGGDKHNKRIFKTTLPVHESVLDIRILDKTIKNQD